MRSNNPFFIVGFLALSLLTACGLAQAAPLVQTDEQTTPERTITVSGFGRVTVTPDIARISIGVQSEGEDATSAVEENSTQTRAVIDTLLKAEIAEEDIRTTNFSIFPREERDRDGTLLSIRYVVNNTVNVTIRDLDSIGEVLDAVVQAGANNISGIQFDVADRSSASSEALVAAVQDAQNQGEILAKAAGVTLGQVKTINTTVSGGVTPFPVRESVDFIAAAEVPISPGEMEINVQVLVVFDIQ